jgi:hypothetical protein
MDSLHEELGSVSEHGCFTELILVLELRASIRCGVASLSPLLRGEFPRGVEYGDS